MDSRTRFFAALSLLGVGETAIPPGSTPVSLRAGWGRPAVGEHGHDKESRPDQAREREERRVFLTFRFENFDENHRS